MFELLNLLEAILMWVRSIIRNEADGRVRNCSCSVMIESKIVYGGMLSSVNVHLKGEVTKNHPTGSRNLNSSRQAKIFRVFLKEVMKILVRLITRNYSLTYHLEKSWSNGLGVGRQCENKKTPLHLRCDTVWQDGLS